MSARTNTRGRVALGEYFASEGAMSQTALAVILGIEQPSISSWLHGNARPEPRFRSALERLIGISADDWKTKKEIEAEAALLKRIDKLSPSKPAA